MAKCLSCGNTTNFNVWCNVSKVLEVELDSSERIKDVIGEPEDEELQDMEEYRVLEDDLEFAMVGCSWCGGKDVLVDKSYVNLLKKKSS